MTTMESANCDSYTANSDSEKMSADISVLPLTSESASDIQTVEVSTQLAPVINKTLYTALPEMVTKENPNNYVLINLQDLQDKVWNGIGTPFLVLTNNDKGNVEAKVLYNASSVGLIKLPPTSGANIHTSSQPSSIVVSSTTTKTLKQTSPNTLIQISSKEPVSNVGKTETFTKSSLESKQLQPRSVINPTATVNTVSVGVGTEQVFARCSKSFTGVGYKKCNQSTSNSSEQRSLECSFDGCDRRFSWPAHLKYHQMTHTGERQYACTSDGCRKTFYTSQRLAVHIRTHTGERPFKCREDGCEKAFTTAGNLKNHRRVHTGERPFVCSYVGCSRSFAEYSSLRKHKLVHTGEKPFICDKCGKTFSQSGSRTVHVKRHHGIDAKKETTGEVTVVQQQQQQSNTDDVSFEKKSANIFIFRNAVEDNEGGIMSYQDFPGGESVVFSQDMSDHVVTVTTQPCAASAAAMEVRVVSDQIMTMSSQPSAEAKTQTIDVSQGEMLSSEILPSCDSLTRVSQSSNVANVMVLSQPQEMVDSSPNSTSAVYHTTHVNTQETEEEDEEDIVYRKDLLPNNLDPKEISTNMAPSLLTMSSSLSPRQELTEQTARLLRSSSEEVTLDPMMASDDEDEGDNKRQNSAEKKCPFPSEI